jgi:hypothetical protein
MSVKRKYVEVTSCVIFLRPTCVFIKNELRKCDHICTQSHYDAKMKGDGVFLMFSVYTSVYLICIFRCG